MLLTQYGENLFCLQFNHCPTIYSFVHSAYSSPSNLLWGDKIVKSVEGVQQGDPLGPLLFCLALHQHSLVLLRNSFSLPKLLYILRTAPCFRSATLETYDDCLREILGGVANNLLERDSQAWFGQVRWQETRWCDPDTLEIRSFAGMGRDFPRHFAPSYRTDATQAPRRVAAAAEERK